MIDKLVTFIQEYGQHQRKTGGSCPGHVPVRAIGMHVVALLISIVLVFIPLPGVMSAQPSGPSQVDVEAVYLFNFTKFVRWPVGHDGEPLYICIAGEKAYADSAAKIVAGELIGTRPLAVRTVQKSDEIADCNILFIGASDKDRSEGFLKAAAHQPTLTVSDIPGFMERGGMISLIVLNNRVRFAVNLEAVEKSGLSLSSELLKVAVKVEGNSSGGTLR
jgi:hypothetical protein